MENRSPSVVAGLIALLLLPLAALAADSGVDPEQQAAWQERLDKAAAIQAESKARQAEAEKLLEEKNTLCAKKFLVNDCRKAAHREYLKSTSENRRQESEGKAQERAVKKEQFAAREKKRAEDTLHRDASARSHQVESIQDRQATEQKIAATRAEKAVKAAEGERRKAADAAKHQKKLADHEARVAEKMRDAEQRAADAAARGKARAEAKARARN